MNQIKNILVTTFGGSWQIVPELWGFTNHDKYPLYKKHKEFYKIKDSIEQHNIKPVQSIYIIHTDSQIAFNALKQVEKWGNELSLNAPEIKLFAYKGVSDLSSPTQCKAMADLIHRTVLHAKHDCNGGAFYISIAGGRKNMSADIQRARDFFGCNATLHIADSLKGNSVLRANDYSPLNTPLDKEVVDQIYPMIISGEISGHQVLHVNDGISKEKFTFKGSNTFVQATDLIDLIEERLNQSSNLIYNHFYSRYKEGQQSGFYGLQLLGPKVIKELNDYKIGLSDAKFDEDIKWLKYIPKGEQHCHLGGILNTEEIIDVANVLINEVDILRKKSEEFNCWVNYISNLIETNNKKVLAGMIADSKKEIRQNNGFKGISEPYPLVAFIQQFKGRPKILDDLIFDKLINKEVYFRIGIKEYEKLGDLQGSGLLKHKDTLKRVCEILIERCERENIKYCEVRCSPSKYTSDSITIEEVLEVITNTLSNTNKTMFRLIFIASRHGDTTLIDKQKDYILKHLSNKNFTKLFAGFDVAGDESIKSPQEMKEVLYELLLRSIKMTIHAGEGEDVRNIWEAVYELSADRIGHGLTLGSDENLFQRFIDRRICVEMCPTSNYQIIGYFDRRFPVSKDCKKYPWREYFNKGLRVTVNTDNPGISRTTLAEEYYKLACMTDVGVSKWEVLQLVRNSITSAFLPYEEKKKLMLNYEKKLIEIL